MKGHAMTIDDVKRILGDYRDSMDTSDRPVVDGAKPASGPAPQAMTGLRWRAALRTPPPRRIAPHAADLFGPTPGLTSAGQWPACFRDCRIEPCNLPGSSESRHTPLHGHRRE